MVTEGVQSGDSISYNPLKKQDMMNKSSKNFSGYLTEALNAVNSRQVEADELMRDFALGQNQNLHDVILAAEKADLSLQFTLQMRNKIVDAYQEIMRMQI